MTPKLDTVVGNGDEAQWENEFVGRSARDPALRFLISEPPDGIARSFIGFRLDKEHHSTS